MDLRPLGDAAFILRNLGETPAHLVARAISAQNRPGILDVNSAFRTVGIYVDPLLITESQIVDLLEDLSFEEAVPARLHDIACCYEMGEDLAEVATQMGLPASRVVELHSSVTYRCEAIGFSPGFPYLGTTPEPFWNIGRLAEPRLAVPAGSVAIAGRQAAVYPSSTPGGWRILGRTPLCLVDVADDYFPIAAGDEVRFVPISATEFESRQGQRLG